MLIAGTCRDGQFATVAEELATDHLVITYDRRGTTRSAGPSGWSEATVMEQATMPPPGFRSSARNGEPCDRGRKRPLPPMLTELVQHALRSSAAHG